MVVTGLLISGGNVPAGMCVSCVIGPNVMMESISCSSVGNALARTNSCFRVLCLMGINLGRGACC